MNKRELIEQIMQLNRSARREFLESFSERELRDYLNQISAVDLTTIWSTTDATATVGMPVA